MLKDNTNSGSVYEQHDSKRPASSRRAHRLLSVILAAGMVGGISLGVTGTDILHRRASGWMWIMPDRRTIWLRNQSVQVPVVFYGMADGKKREVVFTQITQDSVAGYVILSKGGGSALEPAATGTSESTSGNGG